MHYRNFHLILVICMLFFSTQNVVKGAEPVPYLVRDINTQISAGSEIMTYMEAGANSYFISSGGSQAGLWKTDGTPDGTIFLKPLYTDFQQYWDYEPLAGVLDGIVFFEACDLAPLNSSHGCELWKTDGTSAGTVMAADLTPGEKSSNPRNFNIMGGILFFVTNDGLWGLDAANSVPGLVIGVSSQTGLISFDSRVWILGDRLYFTATDTEHGRELWVSDGTPAGTKVLFDLIPGSGGSYPKPLLAQNGRLYFTAMDENSGFELWIYDQNLGSLTRSSDVNAYSWDALSEVQLMGNFIFFRSCEQYSVCKIFLSDGKASRPLFDQHPDLAPDDPELLGVVPSTSGEHLLFWGMGSLGAYDLWMTNGEEASTNIIDHNLWPIPENPWTNRSRPEAMLYDGRLYFSKNDASLGVELWALNEAGDGSNLLKDIRPGVPGSRPTFLGNCGAWLCFMANDGPHGNELWRTDGDLAHTQLVKDLNLDPPSSDPNSFVPMGDWLYFAADDGEVGPALWRTDGTAENTKRVWYNPISPEMGPSQLVVVGNRLYFIADDIIHGRELWVYEDGQGNPHLISDIAPGYQSSEPGYLTAAGNFLFFIANDGIHGPQLWRTNGTVSGTQMVTNMSTGPMISEGRALLEQNEKVIFFVPGNALNGYQVEMWLSDGTAVGTSSFAKLDSPPRSFAKVNAKWFFYAYSRLAGKDIPWQSDGTTVGTHSIPAPACLGDFTRISSISAVGGSILLVDSDWKLQREMLLRSRGETFTCLFALPMGTDTGYIQGGFYDFNGKGIFTHIDGQHRMHTWVTDGTSAGTHEIPGSPGYLSSFKSVGPFLYMHAWSEGAGSELWVWDGSDSPPSMVADIAPGADSANPENLFAWGKKLYFSASDGTAAGAGHGSELWGLEVPFQQIWMPIMRK